MIFLTNILNKFLKYLIKLNDSFRTELLKNPKADYIKNNYFFSFFGQFILSYQLQYYHIIYKTNFKIYRIIKQKN